MRRLSALALFALGVAGCATPGQVRRVETAVEAANLDRARSDSIQRADLARYRIAQQQSFDSLHANLAQVNDLLLKAIRDNAFNFDAMRQQITQAMNLLNVAQSAVTKLGNRVDQVASNAVAPPPSSIPGDTTARAPAAATPSASALLEQSRTAMYQSAYGAARRILNQLVASYPQAPELPDAYYGLGQAWEQDQPDSARVYYNKVYTVYPAAVHAPSALYKLGNMELRLGNVAAAKQAWQLVVDKYKDSPEAESARVALREHP